MPGVDPGRMARSRHDIQAILKIRARSRVRGVIGLLLLAAFLILPAQMFAQQSPIGAQTTDQVSSLAPVRLDGKTIFMVAGTVSLSADARAQMIISRIQSVAADNPEAPLVVDLQNDVFGTAIFANGIRIMSVTEVDAAAEELPLASVAELHRSQIEIAIGEYRSARTGSAYRLGAAYGIMWTILYALFLVSVWLLKNYVARRTSLKVEALASRLQSQSGQIADASSVLAVHRLISRAIVFVLLLVATVYYAGRVLDQFALTRPLALFILDVVASPISLLGQSLIDQLPNLFSLLFIFLLARFALRLGYLFFRNIEAGFLKLKNFDMRWVWPSYRLFFILLILLAGFVAFPYIPGSSTAAFQGASVLLGLMLTFGANSIASNFLSGLVVVYKHSVNEGDRIQVGDTTGIVEKMSMLDTHIRTFRNELVSVPNAKILVSDVINFSQTARTNGLMLSVNVGIGYDEDPAKVEELLLSAAAKVRGIRSVPKPFVMFPSLNSHDVTYRLCVHALIERSPDVIRPDLNRAVLFAFNKAGVRIMTPFYTADPEERKVGPPPAQRQAKIEVPG